VCELAASLAALCHSFVGPIGALAEPSRAPPPARELGAPFEPRGWLATRRCRLAGCWPAPVTHRPTVTAVPAPVGIANALLPPKSGSLASKATRGVVTACHQAATERHSRSTGGANPRRKYSAICRDGALV
jgi:hypothetical protein